MFSGKKVKKIKIKYLEFPVEDAFEKENNRYIITKNVTLAYFLLGQLTMVERDISKWDKYIIFQNDIDLNNSTGINTRLIAYVVKFRTQINTSSRSKQCTSIRVNKALFAQQVSLKTKAIFFYHFGGRQSKENQFRMFTIMREHNPNKRKSPLKNGKT